MHAPRTASCPHCGKPLTAATQRLAAHCGAAACRHRADRQRQAWLHATLGADARRDAAARTGQAPAAVLWLRPALTRLAPVPVQRRAEHQAFLQSLLQAPDAAAAQPLPEPPPSTAPPGAQAGRLCGQCRGRCCMLGGRDHAFITLPQLLRWQRREPGRTLQDAVASYMARIAERPTAGACLYQGPQGCVLPREDRAEICNSYACDALTQLHETLREAPQAVFAVVTLQDGRALRRAALTPEATLPLGPRRAPKRPPLSR